MSAWFVRIAGVFVYVTAAVLAVWTTGLPAGVPLPVPGLVPLAWVLVGLVWLRVLALLLWWADDHYGWFPRRGDDGTPARPSAVSLEKGPARPRRERPGLFRRLASYAYDGVPWVFLRQSLVWLLVVLAVVALSVLGRAHTSQHVRSLLRAGAVHATATVVEAEKVRERRDDEDAITGYHSTLVLAARGDGRVRVEGAFTGGRPEPGSRVEVLWAPSAPELGGLVEEGRDMERYLDRDWGLTLSGTAFALLPLLLVLTCMLPTAIAAEADCLQEQAWSPLAQTVHATAVTGFVLLALPYLSGTFTGGGAPLFVAGAGLLALYVAMPVRAIMA
ncbi:DUF3592 domain-containing protein [Streptomyces sp. NPDC058757]|uniref:DUF3592 domain-containing protein n=1 Tax=unclassified Streptomyces TaxID=2593676 RepID=UPI0036AE24F8